jgi:uncharacterized SAM-binding protein YcdF (DUF218 family)
MFLKIGIPKPTPVTRCRKSKFSWLKLWLLGIVAVLLWEGYREVKSHLVKPEAIFVLGGDESREHFAAELAVQHPELPVWISGGAPASYTYPVFAKAGVDRDRVILDYRAVDTVTNFTTLVDELKQRDIDSVYLVTSDTHMLRARVIGEIVFGSRGITVRAVSVLSEHDPEPLGKSLRDGTRAIFWLLTGYTGEDLLKLPPD